MTGSREQSLSPQEMTLRVQEALDALKRVPSVVLLGADRETAEQFHDAFNNMKPTVRHLGQARKFGHKPSTQYADRSPAPVGTHYTARPQSGF